MPQLPRHMKIRRSQSRLLVKKRHFLRNYPVIKSCKLLCKELQSNNNTLAKALSKEKQESQLLFSQNINLLSEVQDLTAARNKRDTVISNILNNSKEMLQMLVAITGYLTNTISCCQEFIRSVPTNMRMSCSSVGRRDSMRRLSLRSPTRGVVKPMVSGHTITKPTINLSRVNMRHINNSSNLSIIPEVSTPPRNQELNNSVPARQRRSNNGRVCRMPERLAVTSPRDNADEQERRLSERSNRYSGRISGRLSQSKARLSRNSVSRSSIERFETIRSPRVKLNDVSKLLQNSQSINIRMLTESQNNQENSSPESSDDANRKEQTVVPDTPPSDGFKNDNDRSKMNGIKSKRLHKELNTTKQHERRNVSARKYCTPHYEDPLEGPSWLFDNSRVVPSFASKEKKTDDVDASNDDNMSMTLKTTDSSDASDDERRTRQQISSLPTSSRVNGCKKTKEMNDRNESSMLQQTETNDTVSNATTDTNENVCNDEDSPVAAEVVSFVTQRRGCFENEDLDDYTLMFQQKPRNLHFDINDLILPVLEQSVLKPMATVEAEPEVTSTLRKISQICPVPSASHNTLNESTFNQSTVKLPLLINNDYNDNESTPMANKRSEYLQRKRKSNKSTLRESADFDDTPPFKKKNSQKKRKNRSVKDPSAAKVVLEKLDETEVKSRTPSPKMNESESREFNQSLSSLHANNLSDSDSNASSNSQYTSNRPRRKRAPTTFVQPNLRMKLRRN
ncbi:uncharacterized protein LOC143430813 [Xylocopa sonorina]|uniref:uncharacterized protein LOC143430813 n=1 Tax=Xylocopa sonorina TaxID=1818115 RepID=UPI00403A92D6